MLGLRMSDKTLTCIVTLDGIAAGGVDTVSFLMSIPEYWNPADLVEVLRNIARSTINGGCVRGRNY